MAPNRHEKKARAELLSNPHLTPMPGVKKIVFKMSDGREITCPRPEVYSNKKQTNELDFIWFGELKTGSDSSQSTQSMMEQMLHQIQQRQRNDSVGKVVSIEEVVDDEDEEDESEDDEEYNRDDLNIVMSQAKVTESRAKKALRAHKMDVVNAIMSLC